MLDSHEKSAWRVHHVSVTDSTNADAREGQPGDVFSADFQRAGRGRLNHTWLARPGENLLMSAVLDVAACPPEEVATLPLLVGFAVLRALARDVDDANVFQLKWPNDVLANGQKIAGILCERHDDRVIAGIGVNVKQIDFPASLAARATSLARLGVRACTCTRIRANILDELATVLAEWRRAGFRAFRARFAAVDYLKGREIAVQQTDDDRAPMCGRCEGIADDGALRVAGTSIYAGEAHILKM